MSLLTRTETCGSGCPAKFLQRITEAKMVRWWKLLCFRDIRGQYIAVYLTWHGYFDESKFIINSSLAVLRRIWLLRWRKLFVIEATISTSVYFLCVHLCVPPLHVVACCRCYNSTFSGLCWGCVNASIFPLDEIHALRHDAKKKSPFLDWNDPSWSNSMNSSGLNK